MRNPDGKHPGPGKKVPLPGFAALIRGSLRAALRLPLYFTRGDSCIDAIGNVAIALRRWPETLIYFLTYVQLPNYLNPRLYSEKVQWRKLFDRRPELIVFCDKLAGAEVAQKRAPNVKLPELLWSGNDPDGIPLGEIEPPYVIKANNRSGATIFVQNPEDINEEAIRKQCQAWIEAPPHRRRVYEWGYSQIPTRLLIERSLPRTDRKGSPADLKIFVFDGRATYLYWRDVELGQQAIHDRSWQRLDWERWDPLEKGKRELMDGKIPKPAALKEIILIAEAIAADLDHLRVDLYDIAGDVYFGEGTIYVSSGHKTWFPSGDEADPAPSDEINRKWGEHWTLPELTKRTKWRRGIFK